MFHPGFVDRPSDGLPRAGQHRSTQRHVPTGRDDERLTADIVELARQYGRGLHLEDRGFCDLPPVGSSTTNGSTDSAARGARKFQPTNRVWPALADERTAFVRVGGRTMFGYDFVEDRTMKGKKDKTS